MKRKRRFENNGDSFLIDVLLEMLVYIPRLLFRIFRWVFD